MKPIAQILRMPNAKSNIPSAGSLYANKNALIASAAGIGFATAAFYLYRHFSANANTARDTEAPSQSHHWSGKRAVNHKTVLILKPRQELYEFWRDFKNLPQFMDNVEKVETDGNISTWTIRAPAGQTVTVKSNLIEDRVNERLAWRSTDDSQIESEGYITFTDAPGGRGTYVEASIAYKPPGGQMGKWIAQLFRREPEVQARHELKRFKMLMEAGEVATSARTQEQRH